MSLDSILAFDLKSGATRWEIGALDSLRNKVMVLDKELILIHENGIKSLGILTGAKKHELIISNKVFCAIPPLINRDRMFCVSKDSVGFFYIEVISISQFEVLESISIGLGTGKTLTGWSTSATEFFLLNYNSQGYFLTMFDSEKMKKTELCFDTTLSNLYGTVIGDNNNVFVISSPELEVKDKSVLLFVSRKDSIASRFFEMKFLLKNHEFEKSYLTFVNDQPVVYMYSFDKKNRHYTLTLFCLNSKGDIEWQQSYPGIQNPFGSVTNQDMQVGKCNVGSSFVGADGGVYYFDFPKRKMFKFEINEFQKGEHVLHHFVNGGFLYLYTSEGNIFKINLLGRAVEFYHL